MMFELVFLTLAKVYLVGRQFSVVYSFELI